MLIRKIVLVPVMMFRSGAMISNNVALVVGCFFAVVASL